MLRICFAATSAAIILPSVAYSQDPGIGWGTLGPTTYVTSSPEQHFDDSQSALVVAQGQSAFLAGSTFTINSIGVNNTISVVGDDNILTTDQSGHNEGDVSSTLFLNEDTGQTTVDADSNLFSTEE